MHYRSIATATNFRFVITSSPLSLSYVIHWSYFAGRLSANPRPPMTGMHNACQTLDTRQRSREAFIKDLYILLAMRQMSQIELRRRATAVEDVACDDLFQRLLLRPLNHLARICHTICYRTVSRHVCGI